jgi:hypothetical protein
MIDGDYKEHEPIRKTKNSKGSQLISHPPDYRKNSLRQGMVNVDNKVWKSATETVRKSVRRNKKMWQRNSITQNDKYKMTRLAYYMMVSKGKIIMEEIYTSYFCPKNVKPTENSAVDESSASSDVECSSSCFSDTSLLQQSEVWDDASSLFLEASSPEPFIGLPTAEFVSPTPPNSEALLSPAFSIEDAFPSTSLSDYFSQEMLNVEADDSIIQMAVDALGKEANAF